MTIREEKAAFRRNIKNIMDSLSSGQDLLCQQQQAIHILQQTELYKNSTTILAYVATRNEFSLHSLIVQALSDEKNVALPRCKPSACSMEFHWLDSKIPYQNQVHVGSYGILEPNEFLPQLEVRQLPESTLVLVPALAFTLLGQRLGKGKGFYDRYLEKITGGRDEKSSQMNGTGQAAGPILIGVAYSCQIVETLPTEENDVPMDYILTSQGLFPTRTVTVEK